MLEPLDWTGLIYKSRNLRRLEKVMEWSLIWTTVAAVAAALSAITGAVSAYAAFRAIRANNTNHSNSMRDAENDRKNERLLSHAITTLERSYFTLAGNKPDFSVPPKSRINWLTSARLIEEYKSTKSRITDPFLLEECTSHEAYWRHLFYAKTTDLDRGFPDYFRQEGEQPIQLTSAVIVTDFAMWPDDKDDLIRSSTCTPESITGRPIHLKWFNLGIIVNGRH
jgi:hypothetical protein